MRGCNKFETITVSVATIRARICLERTVDCPVCGICSQSKWSIARLRGRRLDSLPYFERLRARFRPFVSCLVLSFPRTYRKGRTDREVPDRPQDGTELNTPASSGV